MTVFTPGENQAPTTSSPVAADRRTSSGDSEPITISVVIPIYNEVAGIEECISQVRKALATSGKSYEVVLVDDGSTDGSLEKAKVAVERFPDVCLVQFRRNFGQQKALLAGLRMSRGQVVITYDADLQFTPECLVELAQNVLAGFDIASGIRVARQDPILWNRLPSWFGTFLINQAVGVRQSDFGSVKAYSRKLVDEILRLPPDFLIVPAAAYSLNKNFVEVPVRHQARKTGETKWSILRRLEVYLDVYVAYSKRPFEWMMLWGITSLVLSFIFGVGIVLYRFLVTEKFAGTIIFFAVFLFFTGLHFLAMSIIGEFVVRMFRRKFELTDDMIQSVHRNSKLRQPE